MPATRWIWSRIEDLLGQCGWDRHDLDECCMDTYGREFTDLTFDEGRNILRSLGALIGFKRWQEKRNG